MPYKSLSYKKPTIKRALSSSASTFFYTLNHKGFFTHMAEEVQFKLGYNSLDEINSSSPGTADIAKLLSLYRHAKNQQPNPEFLFSDDDDALTSNIITAPNASPAPLTSPQRVQQRKIVLTGKADKSTDGKLPPLKQSTSPKVTTRKKERRKSFCFPEGVNNQLNFNEQNSNNFIKGPK